MKKHVNIKGYAKLEHIKLAECSFNLCVEEGLELPDEIKFTSPLNGSKRLRGRCIHHRANKRFRITIGLREAKFIESEDGKYIHRITKKRMKRVIGDWTSFKKVVHTMAHELAHLKFWNHDTQHHGYTEHLYKKLIKMLGEEGISIDCDPFQK